jgi:hypothetical protein
MHTDPKAMAYEVKIVMNADGSRHIDSSDANGKGLPVTVVREALMWAGERVQEQIILTIVNAAVTAATAEGREKERTGIIVPKLV